MLWFWYALGAAVLWGLSYAVCEYTLKNGLTPVTQLALFSSVLMPFYLFFAYKTGGLHAGIQVLRTNPKLLGYFALIIACTAAGNLLIYAAIQHKNATVASLIEISYPLFVALFSFVLFREVQLNAGTLLGGALIAAGVVIMYLKG